MSAAATAARRPNLRTPEVMAAVQEQVERHYRSELVESIRAAGGRLTCGSTTIHLAREVGFCYGVERAIDLAYAACKVFAGRRIFLLGEIIHNPEVNEQLIAMGIRNLPARPTPGDFLALTAEDVVIVPAFGSETGTLESLRAVGCQIVDTTCGDVMSVWKRVRQNAGEQVTSIIHGKASHEETRATASRALGPDGRGHFLIVLDIAQARKVRDFILEGGDPGAFLEEFAGAHSPGFDPRQHLQKIGVANQTTMLRGETEAIQNLLREAIRLRDGGSEDNFRFFDTICGATQDRQDALFKMLELPLDLLLVIGGYNSSNTTHLVEIGMQKLPTFFIRGAGCLISREAIRHFDISLKREVESAAWLPAAGLPASVGITAGASCPNNLIEDVVRRVLELRGEEVP
ncbi:MAG: 4-hydroxy-3-methylbut-2-enyl diphosphate reductase [Terrimicrobiaceae bacterium]|nr:4-hydroxy-3-methylbut-2-enyl diphosphate reductase [Terrimicrobiaceae bacterium]